MKASSLLLPILILLSCSNSFAMLPGQEDMENAEKYSRNDYYLERITQEVDDFDQILVHDQKYYNHSIANILSHDPESARQMMSEYVAHIYLIPPTRKLLTLIKRLAKQGETDPELDNLAHALKCLCPLELKYMLAPVMGESEIKRYSTQQFQSSMNNILIAFRSERLLKSLKNEKKDKLPQLPVSELP